jgi:NADPH:quinone reductase-like Zn-dependent oxidoreductase
MLVRLGASRGIRVICVVRRQQQANILRSIGADHVLISGDADFASQLRRLAHEMNATLFLDALGGGRTQEFLNAAPFGSTVVAYGKMSQEPAEIDTLTLVFQDKRVEGFFLRTWLAKRNMLQMLKLTREIQRLASSALQTPVRTRLPLYAAQQGVELYRRSMTGGKVLLVADPEKVPCD